MLKHLFHRVGSGHQLPALEAFLGAMMIGGYGVAVYLPGAPILRDIMTYWGDPAAFGMMFMLGGSLMMATALSTNRLLFRLPVNLFALACWGLIAGGGWILGKIGTAVTIGCVCLAFNLLCAIELWPDRGSRSPAEGR